MHVYDLFQCQVSRSAFRLLLTSVLLASLLQISSAWAAVPHLIRYQGRAVDAQQVPLEGTYSVTFRLYDAATGGTVVWSEPQSVSMSKGQFSVLLGQQTPLNITWNQPLWLSIQVGADPELLPRQPITSVPLAIRAEVAEQLANPTAVIPSGGIILWTGATCPVGYTRFSALDGRFVVGGTVYNPTAGGSDTKDISHTHGSGSYTAASHTHSAGSYAIVPTTTNGGGCCAGGLSNPPASTPVSGTSGSSGSLAISGNSGIGGPTAVDIRPAFATILLCQKD